MQRCDAQIALIFSKQGLFEVVGNVGIIENIYNLLHHVGGATFVVAGANSFNFWKIEWGKFINDKYFKNAKYFWILKRSRAVPQR